LLAGLRKSYSTDFTKFGVKAAHGPRKKPLDFGCKSSGSRFVTVGVELRLDIVRWEGVPVGGYVLPSVSLIVTILRHQRSRQRYALYWVSF